MRGVCSAHRSECVQMLFCPVILFERTIFSISPRSARLDFALDLADPPDKYR